MTDSLRWMKDLDVAGQALQPLRDIQRLADPYSESRRQIDVESKMLTTLRREEAWRKSFADMGQSSALAKLNDQWERQRKLMEGPSEQARRLGVVGLGMPNILRGGLTAMQLSEIPHTVAFRLPQIDEIGSLARRAAEAAELTRRAFATTALEAEMARMHEPWLRVGAEAASARGFAGILAIGHGLAERVPFGGSLGAKLRGDFGDWRDVALPSADRWLDPGAGSAFYVERGFDPNLTDFTPAAFEASLRIAGLCQDGPASAMRTRTMTGRGRPSTGCGSSRPRYDSSWTT